MKNGNSGRKYGGIAVVVFSLIGAACGSGDDDDADSTADQENSISQDFLFGRSSQSDHDWREGYVQRCMEDEGFEYSPSSFDPKNTVNIGFGESLEEREAYGFGVSLSTDQAAAALDSDDNSNRLQSMSEADRTAFLTASDTCRESASAELEANRAKLGEALSADDSAFVSQLFSTGEPRMNSALDEWSTCMTDAGWTVTDRDSLISELENRWQSLAQLDPSSPDVVAFQSSERQLAVDEYECKQEHLDSVQDEIISDLDQRLSQYDISIYD